MKTFFNLYVVSRKRSGMSEVACNKLMAINIDNVESVESSIITLSSGMEFSIGARAGDEWAEFISAVYGSGKGSVLFDPAYINEKIINAKRWEKYKDYCIECGGSLAFCGKTALEMDDFVDNLRF